MFRRPAVVRFAPAPSFSSLRASGPNVAYTRQWESTVARHFEQERQRRGEKIAQRLARVNEQKDFTPVHDAFPALRRNAFAGLVPTKRKVLTQPIDAHVVTVAVVGPPNAGKSSLVNSLTTVHANATSMRAGTTTKCADSASHVGNTQITFIDTPGLFVPAKGDVEKRRKQSEHHPHLAYEGFDSLMRADVVAFTYNSEKILIEPDDVGILRKVAKFALKREMPLALVLTKHDLVRNKSQAMQDRYVNLRRTIDEVGVEFADTFETSAKSFWGIIELKDFLARYARPGDWEYHRDESSLLLPPERASMALTESINRFVQNARIDAISHRIAGWTRRSNHTEVFAEVFVPNIHTMSRVFAALSDIAPHSNEVLSFQLNTRCRFVIQVLLTPGGMASRGR